jgi:hypothetical protein
VQFEPPGLQACDIEQIIREFDEACSSLIDVRNGFHLPIGELWAFATGSLDDEHLGKAFEDGKRIAQFMGSDPNEFVFEPLGLF